MEKGKTNAIRLQYQKKLTIALLCGMLGCVCFGAGDWLMLFGETAHEGELYWLTEGTAQIPAWRNALAMALSFPGIVLYGIALFAVQNFIKGEKQRRRYHYLTAFGLTPWLCLHLLYIMILYVFAWLRKSEYSAAALPTAQAMYTQFQWLVPVSEVLMLVPFVYWIALTAMGGSVFPRWSALIDPLTVYLLLSLGKVILPDNAFRIGFVNGLMSESMLVWFAALLYGVWKGAGAEHTRE